MHDKTVDEDEDFDSIAPDRGRREVVKEHWKDICNHCHGQRAG